jgi:ABC-type Mn2+/Zn2+ transport system permease subunit
MSVLAVGLLVVAIFAANVAVAHADDYVFGQVAALNSFDVTSHSVDIMTAGGTVTIAVDEVFWNTLEVGDTLVKNGESWTLLNKRIGLNGLQGK